MAKKKAIKKVVCSVLIFVLVMSVIPVSVCATHDQAQIQSFTHTSGTVEPGSSGTASVTIKNTKLWDGYDASRNEMIPLSYDEQVDTGAFSTGDTGELIGELTTTTAKLNQENILGEGHYRFKIDNSVANANSYLYFFLDDMNDQMDGGLFSVILWNDKKTLTLDNDRSDNGGYSVSFELCNDDAGEWYIQTNYPVLGKGLLSGESDGSYKLEIGVDTDRPSFVEEGLDLTPNKYHAADTGRDMLCFTGDIYGDGMVTFPFYVPAGVTVVSVMPVINAHCSRSGYPDPGHEYDFQYVLKSPSDSDYDTKFNLRTKDSWYSSLYDLSGYSYASEAAIGDSDPKTKGVQPYKAEEGWWTITIDQDALYAKQGDFDAKSKITFYVIFTYPEIPNQWGGSGKEPMLGNPAPLIIPMRLWDGRNKWAIGGYWTGVLAPVGEPAYPKPGATHRIVQFYVLSDFTDVSCSGKLDGGGVHPIEKINSTFIFEDSSKHVTSYDNQGYRVIISNVGADWVPEAASIYVTTITTLAGIANPVIQAFLGVGLALISKWTDPEDIVVDENSNFEEINILLYPRGSLGSPIGLGCAEFMFKFDFKGDVVGNENIKDDIPIMVRLDINVFDQSEGLDSIGGSGSGSFVSYLKIPINHKIIELPETPIATEMTFTNTIDMEFVLIPAGEFDMGSPSDEEGRCSWEGPVHHVTIENPFYMCRYEVTQKQWHAIMGDKPTRFTGDDDLPAELVSWYDVQEFIRKLNDKEGTTKYRLPSEAEWEYACRAGTSTRYSFGDDDANLGDYAWYHDNSGHKTHPVGQKKPNSWGLYDMYGNVWEWVQDCWHDSYNGAPADGSAWVVACTYGANRVIRGSGCSYRAGCCRSAARGDRSRGPRRSDLGFRLLREV